ncbi:MAG TPA: hypothetical protein VIU93_02870 [Gallionellaceae bacterium]
MKKLSLVAALVLAGLASLPAQAAVNVPAPFAVIINLTTACAISTPPVGMTIAYLSNAPATSATIPVGITCTNTLPYDLTISTTPAAAAIANPVTSTAAALTYNLNIAAGGAGAGAASTTSSLLGNHGSGTAQTYTIGAYLPSQSGTCGTATCTSTDTYFLNVSY